MMNIFFVTSYVINLFLMLFLLKKIILTKIKYKKLKEPMIYLFIYYYYYFGMKDI